MFHVHFSNRLEVLRERLLDQLARSPGDIFAFHQVVVPGAALRRHLSLALADRLGIAAGVNWSFLAQWLWRRAGEVLPGVAEQSPFTVPALTWRIDQCLEEAGFVARHPRLAAYLGRTDRVARFDFAVRLAEGFDQYLTWRPDWLAAWSEGRRAAIPEHPDQDWQAELWRRLAAGLGAAGRHPLAELLQALTVRHGEGLPAAVHVFCPPAIPPLYLDTLRRLGEWMEVHVYALNPCREYWFEIVDPRRLAWLAARGQDAHHETGNRLLAAWGGQTRAHLDLLLEAAEGALVDDEGFLEAPGDSLLARLQNAILDLREPEPGPVDAADRSIEIHVCHSLTRQLEVLRDQLLDLFCQPDPPRPGDILVVTPDLEAAAPLVEAVFGNAPPERFIPYLVSGRARVAENPLARAFLDLLRLLSSRCSASQTFDLLRQTPVRRRLGLEEADLERVRSWLRAAGVRWGLDAAQRRELGLPALERFSFDDGLQRLLLGYALPADSDAPLGDLLPAGDVEGSDALILGRLVRFVDDLARLRREARAASPRTWARLLAQALETFLVPDQPEELAEVRDALSRLLEEMEQGGAERPIPLEVVVRALEQRLEEPASGGAPGGAVTFTALSVPRNLPYRVICILGLEDGAFPGQERPAEFDLLAHAPRRGDRQRRRDDRNLFLDLLLAARQRLLLCYTGRGIRDNAPLPPSILVSELLEALAPTLGCSREETRQRLCLEHPLQAFSPRYFAADADPRLASFQTELCEALRHAARPVAPAPFFARPLAPPGPEWREANLEQLIRFFRHPARYLLRQRLGVELAEAEEELQDAEPFLPDAASRRDLAARLLSGHPETQAPERLQRLAAAGVEYPPGPLGAILLERELTHLKEFAARWAAAAAEPCLPPWRQVLSFDLEGECWRLAAEFPDLRPGGLVRQRYDEARPGDYLEAWLQHLFLCAAAPEGVQRLSRRLHRTGEFRLRPCADAPARLAALLRLYRQGLMAPLCFTPRTAWAYLEKGRPGQARALWEGAPGHPGEADHPAWRLALRGQPEPLDEDFLAHARIVLGGVREHLEPA